MLKHATRHSNRGCRTKRAMGKKTSRCSIQATIFCLALGQKAHRHSRRDRHEATRADRLEWLKALDGRSCSPIEIRHVRAMGLGQSLLYIKAQLFAAVGRTTSRFFEHLSTDKSPFRHSQKLLNVHPDAFHTLKKADAASLSERAILLFSSAQNCSKLFVTSKGFQVRSWKQRSRSAEPILMRLQTMPCHAFFGQAKLRLAPRLPTSNPPNQAQNSRCTSGEWEQDRSSRGGRSDVASL